MPRCLIKFARFWCPLLGALWLLAGCTEGDRVKTAAEIDEPAYREGLALLKTGRRQEALTAFLKVIDKRGEDAPESHLEIGMLYAQHINDPLSAIYHFKKYLALRPNSQQAPLIRQRIDAATREFARTLPAQPLENQLQRVDLVATLDKLKQENEALKQELANAKAGRGTLAMPAAQTPTPAVVTSTPAPANEFSLSLEVPSIRTRSTPTRPPASTPSVALPKQTPSTAPLTTPASTSAGNRRHTVMPGDTLSKISQQYYGNRTRVNDILAANRGTLRSAMDLKAGMVLRIP